MFVAREYGCAFLALDCDRSNFGVEASAGLRRSSALLRHERKLVLLVARDLVLPGQNFSRLAHQHLCHRAEESVAIHTIDKLLIAEAISPARALQIIRKPRHRLGAARQHAIEVAGGDLLEGKRDGLDAGSACLIHSVGWHFLRNAASDGNLPCGIGTSTRLPGVAE